VIPVPIPEELGQIARALALEGGRAILVGGAVRDCLLGSSKAKDCDVEVFGLGSESLEQQLKRWGRVELVGKSFGVWKLWTPSASYDFSLPRRERKIAPGHQGFSVTAHPEMSFAEASSRRDFTINSMGYEITTQSWHDPHGGMTDLSRQILRHVGPAFSEDPLRAFRAVQFVGRFQLSLHPDTVRLCRVQNLREVAPERVFEELRKLLLRAPAPSLGLLALREINALSLFPELEALIGVPHEPEWHPEGDVWAHTLMVLDEAARLREPENPDSLEELALMLGALCHDMGKPATLERQQGRWQTPKHDLAGETLADQFLCRLTWHQQLRELVKGLVRNHLSVVQLHQQREVLGPGAIRRLALRVSIPLLVRLAQADFSGRTLPEALRREFPAGTWLLEEAERLAVMESQPHPLLKGRHLMELGVLPGPEMGALLREAFEKQLDGEFDSVESGITWVEARLKTACS
jgi:tRNA nucleotidyltransferase (CCA-adding enzyme)